MEDDKLAAYYDELTRKGGGAARFKQGLGFSTSNDSVPDRGSALPATTSTSFLSSFVRASSPSKPDQFDNKAQLKSIQNKLTKNPQPKTLNLDTKSRSRSRSPTRRRSRSRSPTRKRSRSRSPTRRRSRSRDRHSRRRIRSRSKDRHSRRRSRSRERRSRRGHRSRSRSREKNRERRKREESPEKDRKGKGGGSGNGSGTDFAKLIQGYDHMTPAERVKAKMKLQLSRTAENDEAIGKGSGWERFDFDKDAPLDDEEIEAGEDDAAVVKHIGQSFRFSAVEARNEEQIRAAHDEAMFGASSCPPPAESEDEVEGEDNTKQNNESAPVTNLLSDKVLTMQRGSWRDRARKT